MNNEEDYKNFLRDFASKPNDNITPDDAVLPAREKKESNTFTPFTSNREIKVSSAVSDKFMADRSRYEEIFIETLPLGRYYPPGTKILLRSCETKEIQDFSAYDRMNPFDFKFKLNDIIENCVVVQNPDGSLGTHLKLFDGDRVFIIYNIREKTFPAGKVLTTSVKFKKDGKMYSEKIELVRSNIDIYDGKEIDEFFNREKGVFEFYSNLRDEPFEILPPTLGLKNCFEQYMMIKAKEKNKEIDKLSPFLTIAPILKPFHTYMSFTEIEEYYMWFTETLTPDEYSFLYDLVTNHLKIGIRGLKKNMGGGYVRTPRLYPDKPETLFIVPDAFRLHVRKQDTPDQGRVQ